MLSTIIEDTWELHLREMWSGNQSAVRMELLAEFGTVLGEDKIANFVAMGPEPWSIAFDHVVPLRQVRYSFAHGNFYPALVGACALGERIFNHLILALREDYGGHSATTRRVRSDDTFTNWNAALDVLQGWGVGRGTKSRVSSTFDNLFASKALVGRSCRTSVRGHSHSSRGRPAPVALDAALNHA